MSTSTTRSIDRSLLLDERVLLWALLAGVVIVYANTLAWVADFWDRPEYSHGYLIPAFSCVLIWLRRPADAKVAQSEQKLGIALMAVGVGLLLLMLIESFQSLVLAVYPAALAKLITPGQLMFLPALAGAVLLAGKSEDTAVAPVERWAGLGLLALGLGLRLTFSHYALIIPEMYTLLITLGGTVLLVGGWRLLAWTWPAIAFLIFMFPLPDVVEQGLLAPLQRLATICSTFCLQTLGLPTYREGNRIVVGEMHLGVVDACSGLRMLTIFFALSTAITLVTVRPMWERVAIVLSAIPIALACNIARITITGVLYQFADRDFAERFFHDGAGLVMMPMALGLLYCELQILSHLVEDDSDEMSLDLMHASGEAV